MKPITAEEYKKLPDKMLYAIAKPKIFGDGHDYFLGDGSLAALPKYSPGRTMLRDSAYMAAMADPESDGIGQAMDEDWRFIPLKASKTQPKESENAKPQASPRFAPYSPFEEVVNPNARFPVEALPEPFRAYDEAAARSFQVDTVLPGMGTLCTLSAIFSRCGFRVQVYEEWIEWLGLYGMVIAPPSGMKSPCIGDKKRPMDDVVIQLNQELAEKISFQKSLLDAKKKRLETIKAGYAKGNKKYGEAEIRAAQEDLLEAEKNLAHEITFFVDDITSEELGVRLKHNGEFLAMFNPEGGNFADLLAGVYHSGGAKGSMDIVLKAFTGESHSVHRIGRQQVVLSHPRMTILLGIQPGLFRDIVSNTDNTGRGLCARFLYAFPESKTGKRKLIGEPIPKEIRQAYTEYVQRMMRFAIEWEHEDTTLTLSTEAFSILEDLHNSIEPQIAEMAEPLQEWIGKYRGIVVRIAALLYLAKTEGKVGEIDAESMRNAVSIAEYFRGQAECVFTSYVEPKPTQDARYIFTKLMSDSFKQFREQRSISRRELYDKVKCSRFPNVESLLEGLQELEQRGYICQETIQTGKKGRPSCTIHLNPEAFRCPGLE